MKTLDGSMKLYIANKNYSSWSMRPWIAMKTKGIAFEEVLVPFDDEAKNPAFAEFSPTMKVPVLADGQLSVWESLAILEYLADRFPELGCWPADMTARARARSAASEMHAGFTAMRSACPMNIRRRIGAIEVGEDVRRDVLRIVALWEQCLDISGGPFLFGQFCNADAMYAPVVNRLEKYALSSHHAVETYSHAMKSLPAWIEWEKAAITEPWIIPEDEV
jgi:glutathione S-transferase